MDYFSLNEKMKEIKPSVIGRHKEFSVLITLVKRDEVTLLYQVRGMNIKRQPGEISFPGGAKEAGENDLQCALRETSEELGIEIEDISDVVKIADEFAWNGNTIHIYAGFIEEKTAESLRPNETEVAEVFEVPLKWFMENSPEIYKAEAVPSFLDNVDEGRLGFPDGYSWGILKREVPAYFYKDYCIWGLTGRITKHFVETLCI